MQLNFKEFFLRKLLRDRGGGEIARQWLYVTMHSGLSI